MPESSKTPLLDTISTPAGLKGLKREELIQLADELRTEVIDAVSVTGGHLGAGLGVVELTVALHYVFDAPNDRIIWDVGHQAYPHKVLTGRRDRIRTLRQKDGLSGFTKRGESEYDPFGAGHSSTSISAGLGMAVASGLKDEKRNVIAVIGDGAISAGMAYEAMNNAGAMDARLIVILNDNDMSIAPPTGAMSAYLARLVSGPAYRGLRDAAKNFVETVMPPFIKEKARKTEEYARAWWTGGTLFEELGFYYVGPIDGHNLDHLLPVLKNVRDAGNGPIRIHVVTQKGKGYAPPKHPQTNITASPNSTSSPARRPRRPQRPPTPRSLLKASLRRPSATTDRRRHRRHALGHRARQVRQNVPGTFDVGIAEQHAVTFAAGMATEGLKPFCAIYSTFLQRAYDQVVHDVAIQHLPVRFALDRAGYVGADGPTHAGAFDVAYLAPLPGMVVMAAGDEAELRHMVATAAAYDEGPIAFRYPRGEGMGVEMPERGDILEIGKGRILKEGTTIALLSFGTRLGETLAARDAFGAGLFHHRRRCAFCKPLDEDLLVRLAKNHAVLLTIEEGAIGGFGSHVATRLAQLGLLDTGSSSACSLPDRYIDQAGQDDMYAQAGLDRNGIVSTALAAIGKEAHAIKLLKAGHEGL